MLDPSQGRPDAVSAQVTAKAAGVRVEDTSQRSETTQVFANPDGSWTMASFTTPIFREAGEGRWEPIGQTGVFNDAGEATTTHGSQVSVSEGEKADSSGVVALAELTGAGDTSGHSMTLGWEGDLPAPEITEGKAVYSSELQLPDATVNPDRTESNPDSTEGATDAESVTGASGEADEASSANQDSVPQESDAADPVAEGAVAAEVVVDATADGFSHRVVVPEDPGTDLSVRFPIDVSEGLDVTQDQDTDSIRVVDQAGETVFFGSAPVMWDSRVDERVGVPTEVAVDSELVQEDGTAVLELKVAAEWLAAPERVYPVMVDPVWTAHVDADTYVQSDSTSPKASDSELRAGTFDSGATKARSYLKFNTSGVTGKHITKAELKLWNHHSWSCTAASLGVKRVTAAWDPTKLIWTNQPAATATGAVSINAAKGYSSSCAAGWLVFPVTDMAQLWANTPAQNFGVQVAAGSETNNAGWKRMIAKESASTTARPRIEVTYNSYPNTPPVVSYATGQAVTGSDGKTYVKSKTPTLRALFADPDGGSGKALFDLTNGTSTGTILSQAPGSVVPTGSTSSLISPSLQEGRQHAVKAWSHDGSLRSKAAGPVTLFTVDTTYPALPTIRATGYNEDGWAAATPTTGELTFSSTSTDVEWFKYSIDRGTAVLVPATGTGPRTAKVKWTPRGAHEVRVRAIDRAGNETEAQASTYSSGYASLVSPVAGVTSSDAFKVTATAPVTSDSAGVTAEVFWRQAGRTEAEDDSPFGSTADTVGWQRAKSAPVTQQGAILKVDTTLNVATEPAEALKKLGKDRVPALVEVQVCFTYSKLSGAAKTQCTTRQGAPATAVTRLPHAFGSNYPVAEAGDGQVALSTGELNLSATDVSADAGNTALSIGRTYSSYSGLGADSALFGSGWRANLQGPDAGLAGMLVAEATKIDGTITLVDDDETAMVFRQPGNTRTVNKTGTYTPANEDAVDSGFKLELTGSGADARIRVTEPDGTVTAFAKGSLLGGAGVYEWAADTVTAAGEPDKTLFVRDAAGKLTKIIAATTGTTGQDTTADCNTAATRGCRVLNLSYVAGTKQLDKVTFTAWNPATSAMQTVPMATYAYETVGGHTVLSTVTDNRTGDKTGYAYTAGESQAGVPLLTKTTQTTVDGTTVVAPTEYGYGKGAGTQSGDRPDWLETVRRGDPAGGTGTVQANRFVYGVPATGGTADGTTLPDLGTTTVALWDQDDAPTTGAAVFDLTKQVSTSRAAGISAGDFRFADLVYWDGQNRVVNNAYYAAGGWQLDATVYNADHLPLREYSTQSLASLRADAAADPTAVQNGTYTGHDQYATLTDYVEPVSTLSDAAKAHVRAYPATVSAPVVENERGGLSRLVTTTAYTPQTEVDAGGMPRMLPLTVTASDQDIAVAGEGGEPASVTLSTTTNSYDALEAFGGKTVTDKTNQRSGWVHGAPTRVTTSDGAGTSIVQRTWLDETGRTIRTAQPTSSGTDAGATTSVYYTAGANSADAACGHRPEYTGRLCATIPMGAGSVTERTTGYNLYGDPTTVVDTPSGTGTPAVTRTTTTTYRTDGQEATVAVTANGLTGSADVPTKTFLYDTAGRKNGERTSAGTVAWVLDGWGRTVSYTNQDGVTTTTEYNAAGQVAKTTNDHGATSYDYGAVTGHGTTEYRGLPTRMVINNHGATGKNGTYEATYDAAGNLTTQTMPGTISQHTSYDSTGRQTGLTYRGPVAGGGTGVWASWAQTRDVQGRIVTEATPDAITPGPVAEDKHDTADRQYTYDQAGRLTRVVDEATGTTRAYTFDANGNRTKLDTTTETGTTTKTWAWDKADRMTTTGYVHDALGRITTIPATDAPATGGTAAADLAGGAAITMSYDHNDTARTIKRGTGATTTIGLDATGRRHSLGNTTDGTTRNGYTDDSDNPTYTTHTPTGGGTASVTRYANTIGGDLAITLEANKATLTLNNPHGDTVATLTLPAGTGAPIGGINSWTNYDEYGNPATTLPSTGPGTTYGWHGADQRATDPTGLTLMGARLYNPATGQFTTRDPIIGGNTTTYAHPQDPINSADTTGLFDWNMALNIASVGLMFVPGGAAVSGVLWAVRAVRAYKSISTATKSFRAAAYATRPITRRKINRTWSKGTFESRAASFSYHYAKHGANSKSWNSPRKYQKHASNMQSKWAKQRKYTYKVGSGKARKYHGATYSRTGRIKSAY